jgi:hypothetical protein
MSGGGWGVVWVDFSGKLSDRATAFHVIGRGARAGPPAVGGHRRTATRIGPRLLGARPLL